MYARPSIYRQRKYIESNDDQSSSGPQSQGPRRLVPQEIWETGQELGTATYEEAIVQYPQDFYVQRVLVPSTSSFQSGTRKIRTLIQDRNSVCTATLRPNWIRADLRQMVGSLREVQRLELRMYSSWSHIPSLIIELRISKNQR